MTSSIQKSPLEFADVLPIAASSALRTELLAACRITRAAGDLAHRYYTAWHGNSASSSDSIEPLAVTGALPVEWKTGEEPVTAADRAVSDLCVDALRRTFPCDAVLSEEIPDDGARMRSARTWLVDPIDGTKDFIAGRIGYSVMIGLLIDGQPALGVVYQPTVDRLWCAARGCGAFGLSGHGTAQRLQVSPVKTLPDARMVSSASIREPIVAKLRQRAGIRDEVQIGSIGIKLGLIAQGERDLYINPSGHTKLWDTCAPAIILQEAHGRLTDVLGRPLNYRGQLDHADGLVASNGPLHAAALEQFASCSAEA